MATKEFFPGIGKIKFEGKDSKNPMAFHYYDPEKLVNGLRKVIGLTKLIGTGDEIVPLVQEEIDLLMKIGKDKQLVEMSSGIIENDRVQILAGPLMGMEGNIRRIDRHKRMAYLEIEMFGRTVEMKVGLEIIRKE